MSKNEELIIPGKLRSGAFDRNPTIAAFRKSAYCTLLLESFEKLNCDVLYVSDFHGSDHIERVMLNGAMLCFRQSRDPRDSELVLRACMYHDIGRWNDSGDPEHGPAAARLLEGEHAQLLEDLDRLERCCVLTAISTHSQSDASIDRFLDYYGLNGGDAERARRITFLLKDADNLDRFRVDDFDARHLRSDAARSSVEDARWVFDHFGRKPYIWWK